MALADFHQDLSPCSAKEGLLEPWCPDQWPSRWNGTKYIKMEIWQYHNLIKSYIAVRSEFKVAFYVMSLNSKRVYTYINEFKKMFFFGMREKIVVWSARPFHYWFFVGVFQYHLRPPKHALEFRTQQKSMLFYSLQTGGRVGPRCSSRHEICPKFYTTGFSG